VKSVLAQKQKTAKTGYEMRSVLEQEVSLIGSLLDVMRREQEALVGGDNDQLTETTKVKELLILQHSYLEQTRRRLSQRLAHELGLTNSEPRLSILIDALEGRLAASLTDLRSQLKALVEEIERLSAENHDLIQCSVRAVRESWALLMRQFFGPDSYSVHSLTRDVSSEGPCSKEGPIGVDYAYCR
jgi:flagellar biosynthesis/type III secretory pathway chaperone